MPAWGTTTADSSRLCARTGAGRSDDRPASCQTRACAVSQLDGRVRTYVQNTRRAVAHSETCAGAAGLAPIGASVRSARAVRIETARDRSRCCAPPFAEARTRRLRVRGVGNVRQSRLRTMRARPVRAVNRQRRGATQPSGRIRMTLARERAQELHSTGVTTDRAARPPHTRSGVRVQRACAGKRCDRAQRAGPRALSWLAGRLVITSSACGRYDSGYSGIIHTG